MTTNSSNQPKPTPRQNGYNPITLDDVQRTAQSTSSDYLGELRRPLARCIAAPLLFFILVFCNREPLIAPLTFLVLLGCLFIRLDNHPRQIAGVPLTLAAIKLSFQMVSFLDSPSPSALSLRGFSDPGFVWLPMFFSICLVLIPRRDSVTYRIILAGSCLLLASGLLPGEGFVAVFYLLDTTLFLAMAVGIFIDLNSYVRHGVRAAH
jgi:type IV secretory pathway VirB3-like protein